MYNKSTYIVNGVGAIKPKGGYINLKKIELHHIINMVIAV